MACRDVFTAKAKVTELSILSIENITQSWSHKKVIEESVGKIYGKAGEVF